VSLRSDGLLLDTCAVIWVFGGFAIAEDARQSIDAAARDTRLFVSPISAWEIGLLVSKGRLALSVPVVDWIAQVWNFPGMSQIDLSPALLVASSFLPGTAPRDPADRMILATARDRGLRVVTRDRQILDYARAGQALAMHC